MDEELHLLTPGQVHNYKEEIRNVEVGSKYLQNNTICKCIPKRKYHYMRNAIALTPTDKLMKMKRIDGYGNEIYIDSSRRRWYQVTEGPPCCPNVGPLCGVRPGQIKMICYDTEVVDVSLGSTEIQVVKMSDEDLKVVSKTYNFRDPDKTDFCQHFLADIFPIFLFCGRSERNFEII